jgi:FtsH-binding integral membrane protein
MAFGAPNSTYRITSAPDTVVVGSQAGFMSRVYGWMTAGLALTGVTAMAVASNEAWMMQVHQLRTPLMIGSVLLVLAFSFLAHKVNAVVAALMFMTYAFTIGLLFSFLSVIYAPTAIFSALAITGGSFLALSLYGTITKKDLSGWGTFLFMGLFGIIISGLVNIFVQSAAVSFVVSCASVLVFSGLTAYDTQKLRRMRVELAGHAGEGSLAISGALTLYLDFINLFIAILRLMGSRR